MQKKIVCIVIISSMLYSNNVNDKAYADNRNNKISFVINDFNKYKVPDIPRPIKGQLFIDPLFYSQITRITDAPTETKGSKSDYAFPGYPKHDIENADGSLLIIQTLSGSSWHIWNARPPYNKIKEISPHIIGWGSQIDARWDNQDPDCLYFYKGTKFFKYSVSKEKAILLHDFSEEFPGEHLALTTTLEEGDASDDRRYWAFIMKCFDSSNSPKWYNLAYVVYDKDFFGKDKGKVVSVLRQSDPRWRSAGFISMSPSGKYVWIGDEHYIYPRDFTEVRKMDFCCHADMAVSAEGREVIFGFKLRPEKKEYWAIMADVETGEITYLVPIGSPRYHFSGNSLDSTPGWGVVSTYLPGYPEKEKEWGDHEIFMIELTKRNIPPPKVWRIAHTHTVRKDYGDAPFAKINRKGTKIWFGSGWNNSHQDGQYDVYQIDLPSNWNKQIEGNAIYK